MADIFDGISEIADKLREQLTPDMERIYARMKSRGAPQPVQLRGQTSAAETFPTYQSSGGMDQMPAFGPPADFSTIPQVGTGRNNDDLLPSRTQRGPSIDDLYSYYGNRADAARARYEAAKAEAESGASNYNWSGSGDAGKADQGRMSGVQQWIPMLQQAAQKEGVPWQALAAIMAIESGGNPGDHSVAGATGLMQVMPFHFGSGQDPWDPWTNISVGAKVFGDAYKRYGSLDKAAAAYLGAIDAAGNITGATDAYGTSGFSYVSAFNNYLAAMDFGNSQGNGSTGNARLDKAIDAAYKTIGTPYVWGGESYAEGGFDCSGLIQYAYGQAGVALPRTAQDQYYATQRIDRAHLRNGDLVFYKDTYPSEKSITHVGIYINGRVLNAIKEGTNVQWIELDAPWWSEHIAGYGRVAMGGDMTLGHQGLDAPAPAGARVNAVSAGDVIGRGHDPELGQYVVTFDGSKFFTYGHLSDVHVREGEHVGRGQSLATVGSTGLTTGPHTHLQVNDLQGNSLNAFDYLS